MNMRMQGVMYKVLVGLWKNVTGTSFFNHQNNPNISF